MIIYFNLDERLKKKIIGRAEGEFNKKSFKREFITCFIIQVFVMRSLNFANGSPIIFLSIL